MNIRHLTLTLCCLLTLAAGAQHKRQVAIVAHRGYWNCPAGGNAHNSLAALCQAQAEGFWGSEFDVNMTLDGQLLVFHDDAVQGMKFAEHRAADFAHVSLPNGEKIPSLDDYLSQFERQKRCRLVFELKPHAVELEEKAVDLCIAKLKAHGLYHPSQVVFISFSKHACELFAQKCHGFIVQYLGSDLTPDEVHQLGINGIDTNFHTLYDHPEWIDQARHHGMSINAWTVDSEEDMRRTIALGADYITTNHPATARHLLKQLGIKELKAGKNFKRK